MPSRVHQWFHQKYGQPTPAQAEAWPLIGQGEDVLIASPTGTGKTFAAFFAVLDALVAAHEAGTLGEGIQCVYVSPLRALGYDLEKNLQAPLEELFGEKSPIRVELRSGDTGAAQRARQAAKPPHILLTTPESLCLLLSQERWLPHLERARWLIIDEIHALAGNKRGAHLALSVERLAYLVETRGMRPAEDGLATAEASAPRGRLQRIGLSATIAPLSEVARYLSGTQAQCRVVDVTTRKKVELSVYTPLRKEPYPPCGFTGERLVKELGGLIKKYRTTLVFTNTRSGAEATTYWLRERVPELAEVIECHHASLEREVRRNVEDRLKRGELRAVICSTSLEMGIDIGSVDLVVMLATPKGVSRALQRAGRAGHNIHSVSRGTLMATNVSDLVEACATVRLARANKLDEVRIPMAPLDVLAQQLVSMGCTQRWNIATALALVRRALPYEHLPEEEFADVLGYLAGGGESLRRQYAEVFGRIDLDEVSFETRMGRVRRDFLQNIGTIPDTASVRIRTGRKAIGSVEESFLRMLKVGDIFIMAGRAVRLDKVSQMDAWVTPADGATPTVPRWNASKMPLTNRVCEEIIAFRSELRQWLDAAPPEVAFPRPNEKGRIEPAPVMLEWIDKRLDCGVNNARMIAQMYSAQHRISEIPTADFLLIEEHLEQERDHVALEQEGKFPRRRKKAAGPPPATARHYFFHSLIGRAANDALARVVSYRLSKLRGGNALATPHDYGFVLTVTPQQRFTVEDVPILLSPRNFEEELHTALGESEMVKYHFRTAAQTGLMVYRNYFDERKPVRKVQWSSEVIFNVLQRYEPNHILLREARRETLHVYVDVDGAQAFLDGQPKREVRLREVDYVPPLSFAMYATKIKEALLVEDPFEMMERLYHLWWSQLEGTEAADGGGAGKSFAEEGFISPPGSEGVPDGVPLLPPLPEPPADSPRRKKRVNPFMARHARHHAE